jgi:hypothetical protein
MRAETRSLGPAVILLLPAPVYDLAPVPTPAFQRAQQRLGSCLEIEALTQARALCPVTRRQVAPRTITRGRSCSTFVSIRCSVVGAGLPHLFILALASAHNGPLARPLLAWVAPHYGWRPRIVRLETGSWDLRLMP